MNRINFLKSIFFTPFVGLLSFSNSINKKNSYNDYLIKLKDRKWCYLGDEFTSPGDWLVTNELTDYYQYCILGANEETEEVFCYERIEKYELNYVLERFFIKKGKIKLNYNGKYPNFLMKKDDYPSLIKIIKARKKNLSFYFNPCYILKYENLLNKCNEIKIYDYLTCEEEKQVNDINISGELAKIDKIITKFSKIKIEFLSDSQILFTRDEKIPVFN